MKGQPFALRVLVLLLGLLVVNVLLLLLRGKPSTEADVGAWVSLGLFLFSGGAWLTWQANLDGAFLRPQWSTGGYRALLLALAFMTGCMAAVTAGVATYLLFPGRIQGMTAGELEYVSGFLLLLTALGTATLAVKESPTEEK